MKTVFESDEASLLPNTRPAPIVTPTAITTAPPTGSAFSSTKKERSLKSGSSARRSSRRSSRGSSRSASSSCASSSTPRVVYGRGTISRLPNELGQLQVTSLLIVSSPSRVGLARRIQSLIPNLDSHILDSAVVKVPTRVVDDTVARITGRDAVISIGGGSAVGLARAISIKKAIPHICVPTTYSSSEMTPLFGDPKQDPQSITFRDNNILPTIIIYDQDLTESLSHRFSTADRQSSGEPKNSRATDDTAQWSYIHLPGV